MKDFSSSMEEMMEDIQSRSNITRRQILMWISARRNEGTSLFSIPFLWKFERTLDYEKLQLAFQEVVNAHEILRTVFKNDSGLPVAVVEPEMAVPLELVDLSLVADQQVALNQWINGRIQRRFDVNSCLLDTAFLKLKNGCAWFLNQHHMITDGRSVQLVYDKTREAYTRSSKNSPAEIIEPIPYSEFVSYELKILGSRRAIRAKKYWSKLLSEPHTKEIFPPLTSASTQAIRKLVKPDQAFITKFRSFGNESEGSLTMVSATLTVLFALLHLHSKRGKLTVSQALSNRPSIKHQDILGLCLEFVPLTVSISENDTMEALRIKTAKGILEGMTHMVQTPFIRPDENSFDVSFNILNQEYQNIDGIKTEAEWIFGGHTESSLFVQILDIGDNEELQFAFDFRCDAIPEEKQLPLIQKFMGILDTFLKDPQTRIDNLDQTLSTHKSIEAGHWKLFEPGYQNFEAQQKSLTGNDTRNKLEEIWNSHFGSTEVNLEETLIDQGGDMQIAIKVVNDINKIFGIKLQLRTLFENPTFNAMCRTLDSLEK